MTLANNLTHPTALLVGHRGEIYVANNGTSPAQGQLLRLVHSG